MGGPEAIEGALRRMRGHASYAYNRVISNISGDICKEVIEDPALDEMWEAAWMDQGYQSVAETIKKKVAKEVYNPVPKLKQQSQSAYGMEWKGCW